MTAISESNPQPGFYKMRRHRNGAWIPIAIWKKDGELVCRAGPDMANAYELWTWCADKPVSKEDAKFAFANGHWPDESPPAPERPNMPTDPYEALRAEIADKQEQAEQWLGGRPAITTQRDADYATNLQRELLALNKRADGMFKSEKAPLLEATRACDAKYSFRAAVADVAERLRKVYGRFMAAEETRLKAEAAAKLRAEQDRISTERARKLADDPVAALTEAAPELPLMPEPVRVVAGGGVGRKAGLRTVWVPTINDYLAAAGYFASHPDFKAAIDKLVNHAVRDSKGTLEIPGVTIKEERVAA